MIITPPPADADFGFFNNYVKLVKDTDLLEAFNNNLIDIQNLLNSLSEEQLLYRYEPGKWNIKEIAGHFIDSERSFCYRAMRASRNDQAALPPFDIYPFVVNSLATERSMESLLEELTVFRGATISMFQHMPVALLDVTGPGRDAPISVRALGYAIVGHTLHHMRIIKEKYVTA